MKLKLLILVGLFLVTKSYSQLSDSVWVKTNSDSILFNATTYDFGNVITGENATYKFKVANTTRNPLIIMQVTTSCGCTSPSWTDKPIDPNKDGFIKVKYQATETGMFNKSVFVYTNFSDRPIKLSITGNVIASKTNTDLTKRTTDFNKPIPQKQ